MLFTDVTQRFGRQHEHPIILSRLKPSDVWRPDDPTKRFKTKKHCQMTPRFIALNDMDAMLHQDADGGIGTLAKLLLANLDWKLASLVSDQITMPPITLRRSITRERYRINSRPSNAPPHKQVRGASILSSPDAMSD